MTTSLLRRDTHEECPSAPIDYPLLNSLQQTIRDRCSECGACLQSCAFLKQYGSPKSIATNHDFSLSQSQAIAYQCSPCDLCTMVCPEKLDPAGLFLEVRRRCVSDGNLDGSHHRAILRYEKLGTSPVLSRTPAKPI